MKELCMKGLKLFYRLVFIYQTQITQPAITCSKLTIETLEQGVKYVQSLNLTLNIFHT